MATKSKYGKYICTDLKQGIVMPGFKGPQTIGQGFLDGYRRILEHVIWMDSEVIPGAFYAECTWIWPDTWPGQKRGRYAPTYEERRQHSPIKAHTHPFPELLTYFGTNFDDPSDLGGEVEFWLEDEQFFLTKSFLVYIPAGMQHCPLITHRQDRPFFHLTVGPQHMYE